MSRREQASDQPPSGATADEARIFPRKRRPSPQKTVCFAQAKFYAPYYFFQINDTFTDRIPRSVFFPGFYSQKKSLRLVVVRPSLWLDFVRGGQLLAARETARASLDLRNGCVSTRCRIRMYLQTREELRVTLP